MKYHLSDYERNAKDPDAIVYRDANGKVTRLTRKDFSSEEEFQKWKAISDDDLHERHKGDLVEMKHTVSVGLLSDSSMIAVPGPEEMMFEEMEADKYHQSIMEMMNILSTVLSKVQSNSRLRRHKRNQENCNWKRQTLDWAPSGKSSQSFIRITPTAS
jgi:hypothetical protein